MTITSIITAILIGIVVGILGRLVLPGKQPIGMLVTILVGIVAAFIGTAIARAIGIPTATNGVDWLELLVQVIVAAIGVALVASLMGRRRTGLTGGRRSGLLPLTNCTTPKAIPAGPLQPGSPLSHQSQRGTPLPASSPSTGSSAARRASRSPRSCRLPCPTTAVRHAPRCSGRSTGHAAGSGRCPDPRTTCTRC